MKSSIFTRTYFIIDCDQSDKIIKSFVQPNEVLLPANWVGQDISTVIIKRKDTNQNVNFYEISGVKDKIFNIDSFKTSKGMTIYVAKEINSSEGLYFKANYDMLTKLPNRNLLNDRFNLLLSQSKRTNTKLAVLFIDLDGFKKINDNYGHNAGDLLLKEISQRLKQSIRDSDTIARWGGDEFIILLNNVGDKDNINIFVNRMIDDCSKPIMLDNNIEVSISSSIGVSIYPNNADNKIELLELADSAMYKAKNNKDIDYLYSE